MLWSWQGVNGRKKVENPDLWHSLIAISNKNALASAKKQACWYPRYWTSSEAIFWLFDAWHATRQLATAIKWK